jgi:heterodisulfide reductase subunit A
MRSPGKGFQEYVNRARNEYNVNYIRSRPGRVVQEDGSERVTVVFDDMRSKSVNRLDVDMVVLCTALIPNQSSSHLAGVLGIELDEHGFMRAPDPVEMPFATTVPGVLAAGYCAAPQDIPDSIVQASAAAAYAAQNLSGRGVEKTRKKASPRGREL